MPVIRCTSKLLADIDDPPLPDSMAPARSPIGDWYGHIFSIDRRKCILFINEPTLFVCPAFGVVKSDYRRIIPFFLDVLTWTLRNMLYPEDELAWILNRHSDVTIGRTVNRSTVASMNNRISNAKLTFQWQGGFGNCDTGALTILLNQTPMKPIGYSSGLEQMRSLVAEAMKPTGNSTGSSPRPI